MSKKMYIISHSPDRVGEIIRAESKEKAIKWSAENGRMQGEPIWKLRKYSYKANTRQERVFANYKDTSWAIERKK